MPWLELGKLNVSYGKAAAVADVSLAVERGEIVGLLGPNGAGKTTIMKAIARTIGSRGTLQFDGRSLHDLRPDQVVGSGIALCPEGRRLFSELSVLKNLMLGAYRRDDRGAVATDLERVFTLFPVLRERRAQIARTLSGGEQQMVAIGRALMAGPRLLLLDEPSTGLSVKMKRIIFDAIRYIRDAGVTILLVEQDARFAFELAARLYVLEHGHVAREGAAQALKTDPSIRKVYLGLA
ncbi:MAG: ABC transporter ATP-binding protein [Alphaproteobacteria bacterium]